MDYKNWVGKLHDYVDEEGFNEVSKLLASVEKHVKEEIVNEIEESIVWANIPEDARYTAKGGLLHLVPHTYICRIIDKTREKHSLEIPKE